MADQDAKRDDNSVTTLLGVTNDASAETRRLLIDPSTGRLLVNATGAGTGDVSGPASSTDNAVARFDGTGGKTIQNSGVIIDDLDNVTGVATISVATDIIHTGDANNLIRFTTDTQDFQTGGSSRMDITDSGVRLGAANSRVTTILDEDNMASDSDTALATQQSIKAYVDSQAGGANTALSNLAAVAINTSLTSDTDITDDLGTAAIRWNNMYAATLRTGDTAADTLLIQARDVDGVSDTTFITLTANNTPTCDLSSAVTSGGNTIATTSNTLGDFAATTSAQLAGVISDETGTGVLVFGTAPTFTTSITVTDGATIDADGIDLVTGNAYEINGTSVLNATTLGSGVTSSSLTAVGTLSSGNATAIVDAASTTVAGKVELATTAEIDTGTDSTRAMPVDQFVASDRNIRFVAIRIVEAGTDVAVDTSVGGDWVCPFDGTLIQLDADPEFFSAATDTAGTTGTMVVDVHKGGITVMTTNKLDIESTEKSTTTATTQPDLTTTAVTAGDVFTFDIDAIHTTPAKGLTIYMAIRLS